MGFSKESGVSRTMDSVLVFAYGLDELLKEECPGLDAKCVQEIREKFNGTYGRKLYDHMTSLNFMGYNKHNVSFFSAGEDIGRYEMVNFQCNDDQECLLVPVGDWNSISQWTINESVVIWGSDANNELPISRCKGPPQWRHPWTSFIIVLDSIGLICGMIVTGAYIWNRNHSLIHASGLGVSFLILFGVMLSYLLVFSFVTKPSAVSCYFLRSGYMVCFTTHFAPLLVHTWTIFRRYKAVTRNTRRPGFTSSASEIFFSLSFILVQVAITIVFLIVTPPESIIQEPEHQLTCNQNDTELAVSIVYNVLLIILCSVCAFLTRKVPKNYKESRFIGFSVYTTLVIWVLFIPSYVNAPIANWKVLILSFAMIISASVTLIFLFLIKLYAIYLVPDADMNIYIARDVKAKPAEVSWPSEGGRSGAGRVLRSRSRVNAISSATNFDGRRWSYGEAIAAREPVSTVSMVKTHSSLDSDAVYPPQSLTGQGHIYPSEAGNWL
ncbi:metabotropic glutamate receptor 3-like [Amphiura filiformis]|uniref:metabotropic glutamate receptor 3-like n=1 Tax=Amphiura filiformis TaxID=82378 RepID=UPI003B221BB6